MTSNNSLRLLYNWTIKWANRPFSIFALFGLAFIEAIFFPLPVDPLLMAMCTLKPKRAIFLALITTLASVSGSLIGYMLGWFFWDQVQSFFFNHIFSQNSFETVIGLFKENATLAIFLAAFTPIPYKVFALAGGVAGVGILPMLVGGLIGRGMRFGLIGVLMFFFGEKVKIYLDKHLERITLILGILILLFFLIYKWAF